jgi:arylsulfatase A-like enzyme
MTRRPNVLVILTDQLRYAPPYESGDLAAYQMQAEVGVQIDRVLEALARARPTRNTIVIFSSDHGDMQGAHGGMHEKWHVA